MPRNRLTNAGKAWFAVRLFCCFALGSSAAAASTRVWIDTDPSIGTPYREVDDGFALLLAFHSPEASIAGISTSYGNAGIKRTTAITRNLVKRFGAVAAVSDANVYRGAASENARGKSTAATEALAAALQKERLTYIALGPLTNLATLLQLHPELAERIERVIFIGGRTPGRALAFGPRGRTQIHDANVFKDPESARIVLHSRLPLTLAAPEVGSLLLLTREDARQLAKGGAAAKYLQRKSRLWLWYWTGVVGHPGGPLFDSLGVAMATRRELVGTETRYAAVRPSGELVAAKQSFADARPVTFSTSIKARAAAVLLGRLVRDDAAQ